LKPNVVFFGDSIPRQRVIQANEEVSIEIQRQLRDTMRIIVPINLVLLASLMPIHSWVYAQFNTVHYSCLKSHLSSFLVDGRCVL